MNTKLINRLKKALNHRRDTNLLRGIPLTGGVRLNLSSNDYLNLRTHPDIIRASQKAAELYGTGSGASPLLSGFTPLHQQLLDSLKLWTGKNSGLLFNSGFMANQALIKHLPGPNDLILADRMVHHSFMQALGHGDKRFHRFQHNDLGHLENLLKKYCREYETLFVITESLFSMDGDSPDLVGLARLKKQYGFTWILDEAHALGIYGQQGKGMAAEQGVLEEVDILVGTLGKSFASMGAFIVTHSKEITDYLTNFSGELIYSTFLPPSAAGAALGALDKIKESPEPSRKLRQLGTRFREMISTAGHQTIAGDSPIVPLILEEPETALSVQASLLDRQILVGAVRPPTVPAHSSRLRISLHAGLNESDLQETLDVINQCQVP